MKKTNSIPVKFSCHAPEAQAVFVAGTFNDWRPEATPLRRQPDGHWRTTLPLPPGHHEFKFIVDGQWCCDPGCEHEYRGCPKCVPNEFGTMNRVLEVSLVWTSPKPNLRAGAPALHGGHPRRVGETPVSREE